jgi:hypothetical protein
MVSIRHGNLQALDSEHLVDPHLTRPCLSTYLPWVLAALTNRVGQLPLLVMAEPTDGGLKGIPICES